MRRFLALIITPIIGILILALHLPYIQELLSGENQYIDIYILLSFVVLILINHILTIVSPLKKYEKFNKQKWYILSVLTDQVMKNYNDYDLRFNLMIPKRKWFCRLEPKKDLGNTVERRKLSIVCKVFDFVWWTKDNQINKKLKMTINQGLAGDVYASCLGNCHKFGIGGKKFNFNKEQLELTKDLKFLMSYPVLKNDQEYEGKKTDKVLAVINAESDSHKSLELFLPENKNLRDKLTSDLIMLADICQGII